MSETAAGAQVVTEVKKEVRKGAGWIIVLGVLSIVLGILAINAPLLTGVAVTVLVGCYLLVSGFFDLLAMFKAKGFGAGALAFLSGALSVIGGIVILARPMLGLATLSLILAIYFLVDGIVRIVFSFKIRPVPGWGWQLFGGIVTLLLGIMIWRNWPLSGVWAIGVLVGVNIIFTGWAQVFLGMAARGLTTEEPREASA